MTLTLRPIEPEHIDRLVTIYLSTFEDSPGNQAILPNRDSPATRAYLAKKNLQTLEEPKCFSFGAWDDKTNEMIKYAQWTFEDEEERRKREKKVETGDQSHYPPPDVLNTGARIHFLDVYDRIMLELMGDKDFWHLNTLAVHKTAQGRGAGRMLFQWGLERADAEDIDMYLWSTNAGKAFYEKRGCKTIRTIEIDFTPFGADKRVQGTPMIRPPQGRA
ncbi:MAG: hypothetical protein M1831_003018 [Alyxoria varia]|nr:MAG: hypothetical protein M1831_003018 [Alyxoria varia]